MLPTPNLPKRGGWVKPKRFFLSLDVAVAVLLAGFLALIGVVVWLRPWALIPVLVVMLCVLALTGVFLRHFRKALRRLLNGKRGLADAEDSGMAHLSIPVAVVSNKVVLWYNKAFREEIAGGVDTVSLPMNKIVPGLDSAACMAEGGQDITLNKRRYTAYGSVVDGESPLHFVLFVEDTELKFQAEEYRATRPAAMYIMLDTYYEILRDMRESERAQIISTVYKELERYIQKANGFLCYIGVSRYVAVVEDRYVQEMINNRFDILDKVRKADGDQQQVTLSIGVGRQGKSFQECEEMAAKALDIALGRGGDQAAVHGPEGYSFFGGVNQSVEKRSKVKSRILATSIRGRVESARQVLIMGHKNADMDALGAGVGMLRFCKICHKQAAIVINQKRNLAGHLIEELLEEGYGEELLTPTEALQVADEKTLLIVVDTHMKYMLESEEVFNACGDVVVIDHHRLIPGRIDNASVFYHEPYASSTAELVSELLQYVGEGKEDRPTPLEAEALLSGIILDTRTFSLHVGVRTFEAAAYLRRMGAQTAEVKRLFSVSIDDYLYRSNLVSGAHIVDRCAVVVSDGVPFESEVVGAQAANDLLGIEGVEASIVAIWHEGETRISARSMGQTNVQLIMEKLGGGGHLTMAGAQLKEKSMQEVEDLIAEAVVAYQQERSTELTGLA